MNSSMLKIMMGLAMMSGDMSDSSPHSGVGFHNYQHKERPKGKRAKRRAKAKMKGVPK